MYTHPYSRVRGRHRLKVAAAVAGMIGLAAVVLPIAATARQKEAPQVSVVARVGTATVARGGKGQLLVTLAIREGWHVYAADPGSAMYIPTTVAVTGAGGVTFGKPVFPKPTPLKTEVDPKPVQVYEGTAIITVPFTIAKTAKPGKRTLAARVGYQTCNASTCLPPDTVPVSATITIR